MEEVKQRLMVQLEQLEKRLDSMAERRSNTQTGVSTITVNAGGVGVWICGTACCVMLAVSMVAGMWVSREFTRIDREMGDRQDEMDRMQAYLSAIYAHAPHLKPKEESNE